MPSASFTSDRGNAIVEFIGFAILAIAPIALFATTASLEWVEKSKLQSAATLLARSYYVGGADGFEEQRELSVKPGWLVSLSKSDGVVTVTVNSGGLSASARGIG